MNNNQNKQPWEVNQSQFPVRKEDVLYSDQDYALAISHFGGSENYALGMRWQHTANGFPTSREGSAWMMVPLELAIPMLSYILIAKNTKEHGVDPARIIEAIKNLKETADFPE